jgi:hypothetical protein
MKREGRPFGDHFGTRCDEGGAVMKAEKVFRDFQKKWQRDALKNLDRVPGRRDVVTAALLAQRDQEGAR